MNPRSSWLRSQISGYIHDISGGSGFLNEMRGLSAWPSERVSLPTNPSHGFMTA